MENDCDSDSLIEFADGSEGVKICGKLRVTYARFRPTSLESQPCAVKGEEGDVLSRCPFSRWARHILQVAMTAYALMGL
jgi:hypothetical protein